MPDEELKKEQKGIGCITILIILILMNFGWLSDTDDKFLFPILTLILLLYWLYVWYSGYQDAIKKDERNKREYDLKIKEYSEYVEALKNKNLIGFVKKRNKEMLKGIQLPKSNTSFDENKFTKSEKLLYDLLLKNIGGEIIPQTRFHNEIDCKLIYFSPKDNLVINIEVDIPYDINSRMPLSYIISGYGHISRKRDKYLNNHKWFVIRFAEEQVVKYPMSCVKSLSIYIDYILNSNEVSGTFSSTPKLPEIDCWTFKKAVELASNCVREEYLNIEDCGKSPNYSDLAVYNYEKQMEVDSNYYTTGDLDNIIDDDLPF